MEFFKFNTVIHLRRFPAAGDEFSAVSSFGEEIRLFTLITLIIKGLVDMKLKILSLFTDPQVRMTLFSYIDYKSRCEAGFLWCEGEMKVSVCCVLRLGTIYVTVNLTIF